MTILTVYDANNPKQCQATIADFEQIASQLSQLGIKMQRWEASQPVTESSTQEEVIAAYQSSIDTLAAENNFQSVDVVNLYPEHPDKDMLREKFLAEHIHDDDEVRFFIDGSGLFYIHLDDKVYGLLCEKGDLINVPAGIKHWFDTGAEPFFKCIRMFTQNDGWVATFTGDEIAKQFPLMGD
jgi:1,2-dihydroxy-3-keto-5-methylthiopentene dioxygenase